MNKYYAVHHWQENCSLLINFTVSFFLYFFSPQYFYRSGARGAVSSPQFGCFFFLLLRNFVHQRTRLLFNKVGSCYGTICKGTINTHINSYIILFAQPFHSCSMKIENVKQVHCVPQKHTPPLKKSQGHSDVTVQKG